MFFSLALFGLPQICYSQESPKTPAEFNNQGVKELNAKDFQKAIASFKEAVRLDPSYKLGRENLAIAYNNLGLSLSENPSEALKYFHKALFVNPDSPIINKTTAENIDQIIIALNKNPKSLNDRLELAQTALNESDPEGAIVESLEGLHLKENTKSRLLLFEAYKALKMPGQALYELIAACTTTKDPQLLLKLAKENIAQKKYQASIDPLNQALKLDPNNRETKELYKEVWSNLVKDDPTKIENHIGLGKALELLGQTNEAQEQYKLAAKIDPNANIETLKRSPTAYPITSKILLDEKLKSAIVLETKHQNKDLRTYFNYLQQEIKTHWQPVSQAKGTVVINSEISPEGMLSKTNIQRSSKNQDIDDSALQAVSKITSAKETGSGEKMWVDFVFINGQKKVKVGFLPEPNFSDYMNTLQHHIKSAWFPPKGEESRKIVVVFKVNSDGKISDAKVTTPSGSILADAAALAAIEKSDPFESLPAGGPNQVDVQFTFDYNVHNDTKLQHGRVLDSKKSSAKK